MKKKYLTLIIMILFHIVSYGQYTIITPGDENTGANITVNSTKNGIVLPRMTSNEKNAISTTIKGTVVYDTDSNCVSIFNGTQWSCLNRTSYLGDTTLILQFSQIQIDSSLVSKGKLVYNTSTNGLFMSDGTSTNSVTSEFLDNNEIETSTPTSWANGGKIPVFRLRHPLNTTGFNNSKSIDRDFKIIPYQYGMAVEYNGVLENWVGEFSIHRGNNYFDVGDGGNGWGGVLWVGDDNDTGGLRMTARNNILNGGNIKFTEISSELFNRSSAGNLRLRLVDSTDRVDFVLGTRGSSNVYSYISKTGIKLPEVTSTSSILSPIKGLSIFDNSDSTVKVYNGLKWVSLNGRQLRDDTISTDITLSYYSGQIKYVDATNGNVTIALPPISNEYSGQVFKIIRTDSSSNLVTIVATIGNTINNTTSKIIQEQFECMNLYSKGLSEWIATKEMAY